MIITYYIFCHFQFIEEISLKEQVKFIRILVTGCFLFNCCILSLFRGEISFCSEFFWWTDVSNIFSQAWSKIMKGLPTHKNNIGEHTS